MMRDRQSAILVDEQGNFRYLVDLGLWIFGKVLLPVGRARFDYNPSRLCRWDD